LLKITIKVIVYYSKLLNVAYNKLFKLRYFIYEGWYPDGESVPTAAIPEKGQNTMLRSMLILTAVIFMSILFHSCSPVGPGNENNRPGGNRNLSGPGTFTLSGKNAVSPVDSSEDRKAQNPVAETADEACLLSDMPMVMAAAQLTGGSGRGGFYVIGDEIIPVALNPEFSPNHRVYQAEIEKGKIDTVSSGYFSIYVGLRPVPYSDSAEISAVRDSATVYGLINDTGTLELKPVNMGYNQWPDSSYYFTTILYSELLNARPNLVITVSSPECEASEVYTVQVSGKEQTTSILR
jgi:hypothetical protein